MLHSGIYLIEEVSPCLARSNQVYLIAYRGKVVNLGRRYTLQAAGLVYTEQAISKLYGSRHNSKYRYYLSCK